jgi:hypothetical protein
MADTHVVSALREKRAKVAGCITRLERQLDQHRADLSHIDGVLRLFEPDRDPESIKPKLTYARRTRYFARNELSRLVLATLRDADNKRMSTDEIASRALAAKGFEAADAIMRGAVRKQALTMLRAYRKRGTVEQTGLGRGVRWKLVDGTLAPRPPFAILIGANQTQDRRPKL